MNKPVKISVVICTYNGADRLKTAIDSLTAQSYNAERFEILIIDNNSEDSTKEVCERIISDFSSVKIKYFLEENMGLSYARNRGIKESCGEIVAFIDDDARADRDWLLNIDKVFSNTSVFAVGGKVLPIFEVPRPSWLSSGIDSSLTILDLGDEVMPFNYPYNSPCGTNMAFRRTVFEKIGYFDPALGRIGNRLSSGEETDMFVRMELNNMDYIYCPDCIVYHLVPKDRMTKSSVRKRFYNQGRSIAHVSLKYNSLFGAILKDIRSLISRRANTQPASKSFGKKGFFYYEAKFILYASYLFFLFKNALMPSKSRL